MNAAHSFKNTVSEANTAGRSDCFYWKKQKQNVAAQTNLVGLGGGIKVGSTEFLSLPEVLFIVKHRIQRYAGQVEVN